MSANLLIFDTATEYCSVALSTGGQIFSYDEHCKNQHAAKLLGMIDSLAAQAKINLQDLDAISFGCGPGSFTGVRIAISVAQGLALWTAQARDTHFYFANHGPKCISTTRH